MKLDGTTPSMWARKDNDSTDSNNMGMEWCQLWKFSTKLSLQQNNVWSQITPSPQKKRKKKKEQISVSQYPHPKQPRRFPVWSQPPTKRSERERERETRSPSSALLPFFWGRVPLLKVDSSKRIGHPYSNLSNLEDLGERDFLWVKYNDLTRPHPKWWFMWGMAPKITLFQAGEIL